MQKIVEELAARAKREEHERKLEAMIRVLSALYDRAAAYTNLIIVAGYAAFFTVWGIMRDTMTRVEMLTAALSISLSLTVFVGWEVAKMIITSQNLQDC